MQFVNVLKDVNVLYFLIVVVVMFFFSAFLLVAIHVRNFIAFGINLVERNRNNTLASQRLGKLPQN